MKEIRPPFHPARRCHGSTTESCHCLSLPWSPSTTTRTRLLVLTYSSSTTLLGHWLRLLVIMWPLRKFSRRYHAATSRWRRQTAGGELQQQQQQQQQQPSSPLVRALPSVVPEREECAAVVNAIMANQEPRRLLLPDESALDDILDVASPPMARVDDRFITTSIDETCISCSAGLTGRFCCVLLQPSGEEFCCEMCMTRALLSLTLPNAPVTMAPVGPATVMATKVLKLLCLHQWKRGSLLR